jgi:hypothetical protein
MATRTKRFLAALSAALGLVLLIGNTIGFAAVVRSIQMMDACDPETFNAMFGDGTCVRNGGVTFDHFIAELEQTEKAGAWHNAPGVVRLREGQEFVAENHGGEVHTFTEVDEFGGGFIDELNGISGNPVPAPECLDFGSLVFIPSGGSSDPEDESVGVHHYQCCIHPWMRTDVIVR